MHGQQNKKKNLYINTLNKFLTLRVVTEQPYNLHDLHQSVYNVRNINNLQFSDSVIQFLYV